jgi:hypothetical protein
VRPSRPRHAQQEFVLRQERLAPGRCVSHQGLKPRRTESTSVGHAFLTLSPKASPTLPTVQPSLSTRLTNTARLLGVLTTPWCSSIQSPFPAAGFHTHSMPEVARMDHSAH